MTQFAQNLKFLRKTEGLSQNELAKKVNVTQQCISEYENGKIEPCLSALIKMAQAFCLSIDDLVGLK